MSIVCRIVMPTLVFPGFKIDPKPQQQQYITRLKEFFKTVDVRVSGIREPVIPRLLWLIILDPVTCRRPFFGVPSCRVSCGRSAQLPKLVVAPSAGPRRAPVQNPEPTTAPRKSYPLFR